MITPIRIETLADLDGRYELWAHCEPCWRGRKLDLQALIARLGPDFPYQDVHRKLRCAACQGRTATDIDDLQTYLTTDAGNLLDLIRKTRAVLETHCWTTYPASFEPAGDWLGEIARKIRKGGAQHPANDLYDELDQINGYTSQYYHGEDVADPTPDQIDPHELTGCVRRTLRIVNALQA